MNLSLNFSRADAYKVKTAITLLVEKINLENMSNRAMRFNDDDYASLKKLVDNFNSGKIDAYNFETSVAGIHQKIVNRISIKQATS